MKKRFWFLATMAATALTLTACGSSSGNKKAEKDDGKLMKVTVFDSLSNYSGLAKGWYAHYIKQKFNIELDMVSPNVSGGGDTLFDTRTAAGNLGDLIIVDSTNGRAKKLVKSGLLADMTPYLKGMKYIKKYSEASKNLGKVAENTKGVWGVPQQVSTNSPMTPSLGPNPSQAPYIMWQYYKQLGYPKMKNLDDLVDVLAKMQKLARADNPGKKIYAVSIFKDWDGDRMAQADPIAGYLGYEAQGYAWAKADGSDYQSTIATNGPYVKALRFLNKAEQAGILDPESSSQTYDKVWTKLQNGQILYSWISWSGPSAYNTPANRAKGNGMMMAPVEDLKIQTLGSSRNGNSFFIGVGSKAKNKQRLVKFINWLYSPEGCEVTNAGVGGNGGIKGWTWKMQNGKPVLTDFGKKINYTQEEAKVPAKYGSGNFQDGISPLNYIPVDNWSIDPLTGSTFIVNGWDSYIKDMRGKVDEDWTAHMDGAANPVEYLEKKKQILVSPGSNYAAPNEDSQSSVVRGQIKTQVVTNSWKMVMAKSDAQFDSLLANMQKTVKGLGYDKIYKADLKNAKDRTATRKAALKEYNASKK